MKYLLDTNVISDFAKGHPAVLPKLKQTPPRLVGISSITLMEIEFGLQLNPERARKLAPVLESLLNSIEVFDFSPGDAKTAAALRAALQKRGTAIGAYDVLLAGAALRRGLIFVTANTAEFERINGLQLEDWRESA
ncbi:MULTISPECIES: type II toxin-antitoxin system VapC family toxin [Methylococcus]|uniref:Type II toxin-antitoxin system VapC family toxin n=1 Tax=Methylococcus capsulatus TaxID=414 RepID=A0ABZ2F6J8_METCP|nr:type II toxin-antitoxin system VapC family toxin [Methylococcus capsulatus]MDF9390918.1 type II toxin-antitoxin system VapC family toxin [Methylococcus capsulatus]